MGSCVVVAAAAVVENCEVVEAYAVINYEAGSYCYHHCHYHCCYLRDWVVVGLAVAYGEEARG